MEENTKNTKDVEEDFFNKFMFGNRKSVIRDDDNWEKRRKEKEWLFGTSPVEHKKSPTDISSGTLSKLGELLENVDYIELMENVDKLMASANDLKPLVKKLKPVLEVLTQKK